MNRQKSKMNHATETNVAFPLTPTLSPREREMRAPHLEDNGTSGCAAAQSLVHFQRGD